MSECNDGVVLTNDPDHPYVQCQRCGELKDLLKDARVVIERQRDEITILKALVEASDGMD